MSNKDKGITAAVVLIICFIFGLCLSRFYQPQSKTARIYKQALRDYNNANYQNSYFLFSKISKTSKLKPIAIYRQSMCAKALGDKSSELKQYQALFRMYPSNKLSMEARYQAGQLLIDENPILARKYFDKVSKSDIGEDYKIASNYYKARIDAAKLRYSGKSNITKDKYSAIEDSFRVYLTTYPEGRLAVNVANNWLKFNPNMSSEDVSLVAKIYYLAGLYDDASNLFSKTKIEHSWPIQVLVALEGKIDLDVDSLIADGVSKYSASVDLQDYKKVVDTYLSSENVTGTVYSLFEVAKGKGKDYLWKLKCETSPSSAQYSCYKDLYTNFPKSDSAEDALEHIFFDELNSKDYASAINTGKNFVLLFPNAESLPEILFWLGKMEHHTNSIESSKYFHNIINTYPDSYYAYRAFWILKGISTPTINANLEFKPVVYPYKLPAKNSLLHSLMTVGDYEMIAKYTQDDFIKSWVEYEKGNYSQSMHIAQEAMAKIKVKPPKIDFRWRLVYPLNYYKQMQKFASNYENNDILMLSIAREESFFNSEAQSNAGAIGLMQLMPSTAHDIGAQFGIDFNTSYLFNPELNIRIGNLYYSSIRKILANNDFLSVAAYNGGVGAVTKWKSSLNYSDIDEFIYQIPYEETQNYVRKVFRTYWNYTRIYQR